MKLLIDAGVDVNEHNFNNADYPKPLHIAVAKSKLPCLELLIERNADINCENNRRITPLWLVAEKGNITARKLLLAASANIEIKADSGATPLW